MGCGRTRGRQVLGQMPATGSSEAGALGAARAGRLPTWSQKNVERSSLIDEYQRAMMEMLPSLMISQRISYWGLNQTNTLQSFYLGNFFWIIKCRLIRSCDFKGASLCLFCSDAIHYTSILLHEANLRPIFWFWGKFCHMVTNYR